MKNPKAKAFLKQLKKLDRMYENKIEEKKHFRSIAMGTSAPIGGQGQKSHNPHKMEDAIINSADLDPEISAIRQKRNKIISTIEQLESDEYDVLHKRYVLQLEFKEIAAKRGKSESWATTIHGRALQNLETILERSDFECSG